MLKKIFFIILIIDSLYSETITNYAKGLKGPSLYGVYFINKKPPEYLEDYFQLYSERLYYGEDEIKLNIYFLERGLNSPFRNPSKALCLLDNPLKKKKYEILLKMHLNLKIMQNYLLLGRLYDKRIIYYFNMPFKEDLKKSLNIAKFYYNKAKEYWEKVLIYANSAGKINETIPIDWLENELYLISNRDKEVDWDYDYTFKLHLNKLESNLKKLE